MIYHDVTVTLRGQKLSRRTHESDRLVKAAVEVFRDMLGRHGPAFREPIPHAAFAHVQLQWTSEEACLGCALATFWRGAGKGGLLTTSALVSGRDPAADKAVLQHLQSTLCQILRRSGVEPAIDLLSLGERPLIASIPFPQSSAKAMGDLAVVADMETCLAAAFFLSLGLGES